MGCNLYACHGVVGFGGACQGTLPPALTEYMGREIAVTMHYTGAPWLVRESRQREEDCEQLLKALHVQPGQVVCDMGCGNGFYSLQLAELVGAGGQGTCSRHSAADAWLSAIADAERKSD